MRHPRLVCAPVVLFALHASAQSTLYGVSSAGDLVRIDKATGAGTLVGNSGVGANASAADSTGRIFSGGGNADQIIQIDPVTGAGAVFLTTTGRPGGYGIRGMAFDPSDHLYVALSQADTTAIDTLATIDMTTGMYTVIGPLGRSDIQELAFSPSGTLYALGIYSGGQLCQVDTLTGLATVIGGGSMGGDTQGMAFDRDGTLYAARANLLRVDPSTGAATMIGATGFTDLRGLAVAAQSGPACYPNCDNSTTPPTINILDFTCFLNKFAAGDPYANCDHSTTPPVLNVLDFVCFLNAFAAGCS
jgi:hypothetical protein